MTHANPTPIQKIGLIAGEGKLPLFVAENAKKQGIEVIPFSISKDNRGELERLSGCKALKIVPGLVKETFKLLQQHQIEHIVFAGKVNKWVLLSDPRIDEIAMEGIKNAATMPDDYVMQWIIDKLTAEGLTVLPQTQFLPNLFMPEGIMTQRIPNERDWQDIDYGFSMAKEMGRLDIGQSIVVNQGMIMAVEAIEGTDECLKRAGKLGKGKGGVVVKVAKPDQDQRFDVPTVGVRTLKTMKSAGLHLLATEAQQTLFLDPPEMIEYANKNNMAIVSVKGSRG